VSTGDPLQIQPNAPQSRRIFLRLNSNDGFVQRSEQKS
jgi:hypothetical protein